MIKIVVCDDIPVIRNNIVSLIKERFSDCEIAGVYFDGAPCLEHLKREHIDLIVSDIKMKTVTGIDILKYISENGLNTRVIIITAYPEFNYAKDAVNYHAASFITKPINPSAFLKTAEGIINELKAEQKNDTDITRLILSRNEMQRRLAALYDGKLSFEEFESYCAAKNGEYLKRSLYNLHIKIKADGDNLPIFSWYDICEIYNEYMDSYIVSSDESECVLLVFTGSAPNADEQFEGYVNQIKKAFFSFYGINTCITSNKFKNITYLYGNNKNVAEQYLGYIEAGDYEGKLELEQEIIKNFSLEEELNIISFLSNHFSSYIGEEFNAPVKTKSEADRLFKRFIVRINRITEGKCKASLFKKIDRFLEDNFSDPMLSLDRISDEFNFSSSYISKLFSDYNGISLSERLTQLRLEHAKKLLCDTDISIKDIAARCGYNEKYFSKLFTRRFGINPRQYRNRSIGL